MQINLLSCDAKKPDKRAISKMIEEYAVGIDSSLAQELTQILLDGSPVDMEIDDKTASSAYRAIRKLGIDYELVEE